MSTHTDNYTDLGAFFNEEYGALKAYARSKIDNAADRDAEDIVQDVALQLFSRANSLSPIDNIAGFVYNSLRNKIIDILRAKKERAEIENELETKLMEFSELFYGKSDNDYPDTMKKQLKTAISNLSPLYKNVILALDFEGYSYKELSIATGIPLGTLIEKNSSGLCPGVSDFTSPLERSKPLLRFWVRQNREFRFPIAIGKPWG